MVRSHSISGRAPSRRIAVSALTAAITLAIGHAHSQSVTAQSVTITGRAPIVTIGSITNQTVPGQAPAVGHVLHVAPSATDPDNDAITATNIRWKRGATEVGTGADYATTLDDAGQTLTLEVEATTDPAITDPASKTETSSIAIVANTRPTATPTISGTVAIGSTLNGSPGFADVDNDAEGTHTYQWYRADDASLTGQVAVDGATGTSYAITAADVGKFLVFGVIPRTTTGNPNEGVEAFGVSASSVGGTAPEARTASVSGELKTGSTLTANFEYFDNELDPQGTHTYQWYRDDGTTKTDIANATGKDYVLSGDDQGDHYIGVRITPVSTNAPTAGVPVEVRTASKFVGTAPTVVVADITGTFAVGETLTADYAYTDVDNDQEDTGASGTELQWFVSHPTTGAPIAKEGATGKTYVIQPEDVGANRKIWFNVNKVVSLTGTPRERIGPWGKSRQGVVDGNAPTANPTITGTVAQGELLTGNVGYADAQNDPQGEHTYQWYRATDAEGNDRTAIENATNISYTVQAADFDHYIVFEVIPRSSTGTPAAGDPTRKVTDVKVGPGDLPTGSGASIDGTMSRGETLTAAFSYTNLRAGPGTGQGEHLYQWYRSLNSDGTGKVAIENATGQQYTIQQSTDEGMYFFVDITPKSANGTEGAQISASTSYALRHHVSGVFSIPRVTWVTGFPMTINNRPGNMPTAVRITVWRNDAGNTDGSLTLQLVAPDGTLYGLASPNENQAVSTIVDASSEVANGTWSLRAYYNAPSVVPAELVHFTMEFSY